MYPLFKLARNGLFSLIAASLGLTACGSDSSPPNLSTQSAADYCVQNNIYDTLETAILTQEIQDALNAANIHAGVIYQTASTPTWQTIATAENWIRPVDLTVYAYVDDMSATTDITTMRNEMSNFVKKGLEANHVCLQARGEAVTSIDFGDLRYELAPKNEAGDPVVRSEVVALFNDILNHATNLQTLITGEFSAPIPVGLAGLDLRQIDLTQLTSLSFPSTDFTGVILPDDTLDLGVLTGNQVGLFEFSRIPKGMKIKFSAKENSEIGLSSLFANAHLALDEALDWPIDLSQATALTGNAKNMLRLEEDFGEEILEKSGTIDFSGGKINFWNLHPSQFTTLDCQLYNGIGTIGNGVNSCTQQ